MSTPEAQTQTPDVNEFTYEFLKAAANSTHRNTLDVAALREVQQIESYFTYRPMQKNVSPTLTASEKLMLKDLCRMTQVEPPLPLNEESIVPESIRNLGRGIRNALSSIIPKHAA